uniref:Milk fat globule EGF and factor V/VIII domain containing b n=1 Tax=Oncorhynchus kisutch TaxID=8019 RepID=A0A8C7DQ53_ONCKI
MTTYPEHRAMTKGTRPISTQATLHRAAVFLSELRSRPNVRKSSKKESTMKTQTCFAFSIQLFALCFLVGAIYIVNGDYCEINVCSNGGSCVTGPRSTFICICPDGYTGDTCNDTETGPCNPNPCKNDAFCDVTGQKRRGDVFSEYICKCQDGFDGVHCQNNVNDCANQPCQNGGSCRDLNGDFNCRCPSPYVGKHCQLRCISLLGMEGGGIAESQISASSVHYGFLGLQRWGSELARLNNKGLVNAWTSASYDRNPWIEINMQRKMRFTGIVTQGASRMGSAEFIKAFKVASSLDGRTYTMYRLDRQTKDTVFVGNVDNDSTKTNLFEPPIISQYFRIIPVVCRKACTLRFELVGCELNGCSAPLGMKSRLLADRQISASSVYRTWGIEAFTWQPHYARLDKQGKTNAWTADTTKRNEWLQVDLESCLFSFCNRWTWSPACSEALSFCNRWTWSPACSPSVTGGPGVLLVLTRSPSVTGGPGVLLVLLL